MKNILLSSTFLWLLNLTFFASLFRLYESFYEAAFESLAYFIMILFLVTLTAFWRRLFLVSLNFLAIISIFGAYFIATMGIEIDGQMLNNILSTDSSEASELFTFTLFFYLIAAFTVLYLLNAKLLKNHKTIPKRVYFTALFLELIVAFTLFRVERDFIDRFSASDTPKVAPLFLIPSVSEYIILKERMQKIEKKNISNEYERKRKESDLVVVFVLGESARGDRFGINGYTKNTSPELAKLENIVSFKDATSCHTSTLNSIPCLMTRTLRSEYDIAIKETSFVQILHDLGFATYWFSKHSPQTRVDTFCQEAQICEYLSKTPYDMELLDSLNAVAFGKKPTLVVLHMLGSHLDYNERVPDAFKRFQPLCHGNVSGCSKETLDNSYDNTILYTDAFLARLIKTLKDKNAVLFFTSDHGESLGEGRVMARYGHASPPSIAPREQSDVPFMIWFSDKYLASHPEINTTELRLKSDVSHDNLFFTLLGAAGVEPKMSQKESYDLLDY